MSVTTFGWVGGGGGGGGGGGVKLGFLSGILYEATFTSILMLNCPSLSSIVSRMTWMAVLSCAMPSVRSKVVVVITYWGGAIRLICEKRVTVNCVTDKQTDTHLDGQFF